MTMSGTAYTKELRTKKGNVQIYSISEFKNKRMPYSIKVLLESMVRQKDGFLITDDDVKRTASWSPKGNSDADVPFIPARVVLQDFTGVPAVADLASMRTAVAAIGKDPEMINPLVPVDLVIDHSVNTDFAGTADSQKKNETLEFQRNAERYSLLKWAQSAFRNFKVVPPGNGIIHQINLEYLSPLIHCKEVDGKLIAYPDSCFGTDSHTTQINGLGVVGWGVGGIEAEAVMLGQPYYMRLPDVIGFKLTNSLRKGITATDLVLTVVEMLRKKGVVGKFVEFFGEGYRDLDVPDRATIANMGPEYGATMGFCPIDGKTIDYLKLTGRNDDDIDLIEKYAKEQGLWYTTDAEYTDTLELDLSTVVPSLAGHKRPQDRIPLDVMKETFTKNVESKNSFNGIADGFVAIASITSCTNTSNPPLLVTAALLAKNAAEKGLVSKEYVKTSFAPGSKAAAQFLKDADLMQYLEKLGFYIAGYGCMTCIGNSGPIKDSAMDAVANGVTAAAVVSANRNFEGRVSPHVKANYLASPPLVVAFAIAGNVNTDLDKEPLGTVNGKNIFLKDIWPSEEEINRIVEKYVTPKTFKEQYKNVFKGSELWNEITIKGNALFDWDKDSTYIKNPPFVDSLNEKPKIKNVKNAYVLAHLGDSITTDHISPAGEFSEKSDAGKYLIRLGVKKDDFNSYGSRRGNHEVMVRGTFANIRLKNKLAPGTEGGYSRYVPDGNVDTIFETSKKYIGKGEQTIILAGKEYGTGSSRDWAAKGPYLLGVNAVIAESFERIHRSNLIGMGIVPLQFLDGQTPDSLGLDGSETFDIELEKMKPKDVIKVTAHKGNETVTFSTRSRVDVPAELEYIRNGGIIPAVLRSMISRSK